MPKPSRLLSPLSEAEFAEAMAAFDVRTDAHVAVAVSGGADSLALALLLADWANTRGVKVTALTVDHGLRAGSDTEAAQVGAWLAERGISHSILTWQDGTVQAKDTAVQARARDARYGLMARWCQTHGVGQVFVAHHLGDQAETFVMRLKRSSTLFGLASMATVRELHGVDVCRPLLNVAKDRLTATLKLRGQAWIEDPSNANRAFERVRTRALIAQLASEGGANKYLAERLAGAARAAGRVTEILDRAVVAFEGAALHPRADGGVDVDGTAFSALPQVLRERVLSRLLRRVAGRTYAPSPRKISSIAKWLETPPRFTAKSNAGARTLGGCVVRCAPGGFFIALEKPGKRARALRKARFFPIAPLPREVKGLTSQTYDGACVHTNG